MYFLFCIPKFSTWLHSLLFYWSIAFINKSYLILLENIKSVPYRYIGENQNIVVLNLSMCQGLNENSLVPLCNNLKRYLIYDILKIFLLSLMFFSQLNWQLMMHFKYLSCNGITRHLCMGATHGGPFAGEPIQKSVHGLKDQDTSPLFSH